MSIVRRSVSTPQNRGNSITYQGTTVRALSQKEAQLRQQIWADYIQRMVSRKGDAKRNPFQVTTAWLGWLARQMQAHNQTIFILEHLHADGLPPRRRALYRWSAILLTGLPVSLAFVLAYRQSGDFWGWLVAGLAGGIPIGIPALLPIALVIGLLIGKLSGLVGSVLNGLAFGLICEGLSVDGEVQLEEQLIERWTLTQNRDSGLYFGLLGGVLIGLIAGSLGEVLDE